VQRARVAHPGCLALPLVLATLCSAAPVVASPRAVVLLKLDADKVAPDVVEGVAALITEEIDDRGFKLLPLTRRVQKMAELCAVEDLACLARAADRRGADIALLGAVRLHEGELVLHLEAIEVAGAARTGAVDEPLAGDQAALRQGVRRAVIQLLTPAAFSGSLTIGCNVPRATIIVDGQTRGSTPLVAPIADLTEGSHSVRVEKSGYDPFVSTVDIVYAQRGHVEATMLRRADVSAEELAAAEEVEAQQGIGGPGIGPWSWIIAGAGGALLAGGVTTGVLVLFDAAAVEERAALQVFLFPRDAETVERGRLLALVANSLFIAGGVLALTGVALGTWDLIAAPAETPVEPAVVEEDEWDQLDDRVTPPPQSPAVDALDDVDLAPEPEQAPEPELVPPSANGTPPAADAPADEPPSSPEVDALPEGDV